MIGSRFDESPDLAVWDVTVASRWQEFVGASITAVDLHFIPWATGEGFWCTRVTVSFDNKSVVLILGEIGVDGHVAPSANNVAVLFSPSDLPAWELR